jgi:DNA-binding SARP family transcriptional activator/predicted ATPase
MQKLKLTLLGAVAASVNHHFIQFRTDKIRALLAYLVLESPRPHERQSLAGLFWPEMPEQTALKNLRQSLHRLQQALDEAEPGLSDTLLHVSRRTIQADPAAFEADVQAFLELLNACEEHPHRHLHLCRDCLDRLTTAAALYRGEFLAGFSLSDAYAFEEWLLFWRERLRNQAVSALGQLANALADRGEVEPALLHAGRMTALDPLREEAHRLLMQLLAQKGQYGNALAQYEICRALLQDELGVDPSAETTALFHKIQEEQQGFRADSGPAALHNFPAQFTPFVGREKELGTIEEWFLDGESRLLTLVGPGGIGKTRLTLRAGERLAQKGDFRDGIFFFPLASVRTSESLLTSLLNGLGASASLRSSPRENLLNYLGDRRCLLILDNFDQLVESSSLLGEILAAAPGVRMMVSSQVLLNLRAEQRLAVSGLDYPGEDVPEENPLTFSAVRLFLEAARQTNPAFRLDDENERSIFRICRLVEGHPLALELAANWVRVMDCEAIADEIDRGLDILSQARLDQPERHQSLKAVFANSWQLLAVAVQTVLGELTVFRGPFSLEAASAITSATPLSIARLLDCSLLQRRKDGRYEIHELLRQYVAGQAGEVSRKVARQHSDHFLSLVAEQAKPLYGPQPRRAVAALGQNLTNIRQAWRWASGNEHRTAIARGMDGLGRYYQVAALLQEGEAMFAGAVDGLGEVPGLLLWHAYFLFKMSRYDEAIALAEAAQRQTGQDRHLQAEVYSLLGELLPRKGRFDEGRAYQKLAIDTFKASSDLERLARALRRMSVTCWRAGDHEAALRYFHQAVPVHQAIEEKRGLAQLYNVCAGIYYERNDLAQALAYVRKAGELYEAIEDKLDAAVVSANLARLYTHLGRFEEALASNLRAFEISNELGDRPGMARDLGNRGYILSVKGDFDESLDFYFQALDSARTRNDLARIADFQAGAAAVFAARGDDEEALAYFDLALPVLMAQGVPYHLAGPVLGKAEVMYRRGDWSAARALCDQATLLATDSEMAEFAMHSRILSARLDVSEGNRETGLRRLDRMLEKTENEAERTAIYYEIWRLTRDISAATAALAGYSSASEQVPSIVNLRRFEELQAFLGGVSSAGVSP